MSRDLKGALEVLGPGMLVAATGVGAGDLATAAFCGNRLGLTVLWAVLAGAGLKYVLNEGLARWQLATGTTLMEGALAQFGRGARWFFLTYLLVWSFFVGAALMSACGVAAHALVPLWDPVTDKVIYGIGHSVLALALVRLGGFAWFSRAMGLCVALMFVVVVTTAVAITPSWAAVAGGLVPRVPDAAGQGLSWTIALMGGVGGTLTVLCYGYWIREQGRVGPEALRVTRLDLLAGYTMTALFGLGMVLIGSQVAVDGGGARLVVDLANGLQARWGDGVMATPARWAFLVGAWGAVFSSLMGVWQSVPYLFADYWYQQRGASGEAPASYTTTPPYKVYQAALASAPALGLVVQFETAQKAYAMFGALFIPLLALVLLLLGRRRDLLPQSMRNGALSSALMVAALVVFLLAGYLGLVRKLVQ